MFGFKRISNRANGFVSTPKKDSLESPGKRFETETNLIPLKRLRSATPVKRVIFATTPPPPNPLIVSRSETPVKALERIPTDNASEVIPKDTSTDVNLRDDLLKEIENLDLLISAQQGTIEVIQSQILDLEAKQYTIDDLISIASQGQNEVRNLLNQIYNPGNEMAKRAEMLIHETKKSHEKKIQKTSFELNHLVETSHSAIKKKITELEHVIELHERTLMTVVVQKKSEEKAAETMQADEENANTDTDTDKEREGDKDKDTVENVEPMNGIETSTSTTTTNPPEGADEECVIIGDVQARTPSPLADAGRNTELTDASKEDKPSVTYDDDEATDIEDSKDDERPFTPCQAQRQTV